MCAATVVLAKSHPMPLNMTCQMIDFVKFLNKTLMSI